MIVMIINYMVLIYIELLRIKGHGVVYSKTQSSTCILLNGVKLNIHW